MLGDKCGAHTFPYIDSKHPSAVVEHEATTSKIGEDQIFYCQQRGLSAEDAVSMIVNGFCQEVFKELPMESAVEAQKLLSVNQLESRANFASVFAESKQMPHINEWFELGGQQGNRQGRGIRNVDANAYTNDL